LNQHPVHVGHPGPALEQDTADELGQKQQDRTEDGLPEISTSTALERYQKPIMTQIIYARTL